MRMSLFSGGQPSALATLCLAIACLSGCASKNPLIDEPAAAPVASTARQQNDATTPANAAAPAASIPAASTSNTGVQATGPTGVRRFLGVFAPYRVDVQQGNFISQEMVNQLKEGMTREQVIFVLGTPLLTDVFHANRWDYVFRLQKRSGAVISSRVTVFFDNNRLSRVDGGALPTEQEYLTFIADGAPGASAPSGK